MWTSTITINDADGKPVKLVLKKDLSPSIIQDVMREPLRILRATGDVMHAMRKWNYGMAARIISTPRKYRDNEEEISKLPYKSCLALFAKMNEAYPFYEYAPPEYSEPLLELGKKWIKACADMMEEWDRYVNKLGKST